MSAANNADDYANARIGIFFQGWPADLTGQCVSLAKWFIGEMCDISDWQAARGNAKDFGDTLVRQGLATVVSNPQRGDLAVWKQDAGNYGHIGVVLSGSRVFEANVGIAGTASAVYGQNKVYASRIDPLVASWRVGPATYYRVKSYRETANQPATNPPSGGGEEMITNAGLNAIYWAYLGREPDDSARTHYVGKRTVDFVADDILNSDERRDFLARLQREAAARQQVAQDLDTVRSQLSAEQAKSVGLVKNLDEQVKLLDTANRGVEELRAALQTALDRIDVLEAAEPDEPAPETKPESPVDGPVSLTDVIRLFSKWVSQLINKGKE